MPRSVFVLLVVLLFVPVSARALPSLDAMLADRSLGSQSATVAVIEYSSLTCPHCADFHRNTLPKIQQDYVEKGAVRYIVRDFPLDNRAMAGAMIARCAAPDRYFGLVDMLFRDQQAWVHSANPLEDLKVRAQIAGLSPGDVDACLADRDLLKGIQAGATEAQKRHGIDSTPTFLIDGRKLSGDRSFEEFKSAIDEALAKAK